MKTRQPARVLTLAGAISIAVSLFGDSQKVPPELTFRSDVKLVLLDVAVTTAHGAPVPFNIPLPRDSRLLTLCRAIGSQFRRL